MTPCHTHIIETPIGPLFAVFALSGALLRLDFLAQKTRSDADAALRRAGLDPSTNPDIAAALESQLHDYFAGHRRVFDLSLAPSGTDFQRQAWRALQDIPFGQTRTYAEQARAMGRDTAIRAVGHANSKNPIAIIIPCHRVIGANGTLTGYAGGLSIKRALLEHEGALGKQHQISLFAPAPAHEST